MSFNSLPLQNNQYGSFNYLLNGNFDRLDAYVAQVTGPQNWNAYKDAAATTPVDGTGGSPTIINNAIVSSGTLRGIRSMTITKTGNAQGEGYSTDFTIDAADKSKILSISFDFSSGSAYVASDLAVYIYDITNSTLITPNITGIPLNAGMFQAQFASTTSTSYRLIIHCATSSVTTSNWSMEIDNIRVSNSVYTPGVPITDWQSFTMTIGGASSAPTKGTVAIDQAVWRRVGDSAEIRYTYRQTAAGSAGSGQYLFPLPTGLSLDTTKVTVSTSRTTSTTVGFAYAQSSSAGAADITGIVTAYNSTNLAISVLAAAANGITILDSSGGYNLGNTTVVYSFYAVVPIQTWASSANFVVNQTEYVYNTSTNDANDTTSFGFGPQGGTVPGALTAERLKRVRFQNAIQPTDHISIEVQDIAAGSTVWVPVSEGRIGVTPLFWENTNTYGMGLRTVSGSVTDIDVDFGTYAYPSGSTFGAAGNNWSTSTLKYRVRKSSGPNALQLSGAIVGTQTNDNALAGYIGEYKSTNGANASGFAQGTPINLCSLVLTPGDWDVQGNGNLLYGSVGSPTRTRLSVSLTSATIETTSGGYANYPASTLQTVVTFPSGVRRVQVAAGTTQTVYLTAECSGASGTFATDTATFFCARRMR